MKTVFQNSRSMMNQVARFVAVPALVATLAVPALPQVTFAGEPQGRTPQLEVAATKFMAEAVGNVMVAANSVGDISNYGYVDGTSFMGGYLTDGATVEFRTMLNAGTSYLLLGGGDDDASDVDIEIVYDDSAKVVAADRDVDATPVVTFTPRRTAWYTLRVTLHSTQTSGSFVAMAILQQGGFQVPLGNLAEATDNLMSYCRTIQAIEALNDNVVGFQSGDNQWAVFGSVLRTDESSRVINMHLGDGQQYFLSAGDSLTDDLDLAVTDNDNATYVEDTEVDGTPMLKMTTEAAEAYGIRTTMAHSTDNDYAFVLTAVLSVR